MVSFRDFKTRLCLHLEILSERCIDVCGEYAHRMRRPILVLSAVAILLTLRAARDSIITTKARGYLNDPYDHQGGMYNSHVGLPQGQMRGGGGWFNWSNKQSNNNARFNDNGGYSAMGYDGVRGIQSTMSSPSTVFSTAQLCDSNCHSKYVHVVDNIAMSNMLKNFGGKLSFSGEIATVTSHHNMDRVKAMLSDFGTSRTGVSKVLVVDGGHGKGSAAAIFDSALAQMASANGWAGVILYGCVRQASSLSSIQLGVLATCTSPRKGNGFHLLKGSGRKASHVSFAGLKFNNGGFVYVDQDGILVSDHGQLTVSSSSLGSSEYGAFPYESSNLRGSTSSSSYGTTGSGISSGYGTTVTSSGNTYGLAGTTGASSYGGNSGTSSYGSGEGSSTISSYGNGIGGSASSTYGTGASSLYGGTTSGYGASTTSSYGTAASGGYGGGNAGTTSSASSSGSGSTSGFGTSGSGALHYGD
mmetsp:Transcript_22028/g.31575  ORF Transcript_22028/g.31575 Transcript_22028/m.31575 type:complete len:472 (-) Transcript_22028:1504-2919(-)|eukprot:CAMPEP_0172422992 /NCGR_PEP_ID=MMETSP1064-20121228/9078_1 /TAXON_ID=202472 /ORGANISM="Aulacoseira subarctica , Strain CCAP 1002/5" /LENGTH=471 /DNA_ID=CAMNT_0013164103 /DNA_START=47 /DNA_END=1462 /DNA_ORIENTATION=+